VKTLAKIAGGIAAGLAVIFLVAFIIQFLYSGNDTSIAVHNDSHVPLRGMAVFVPGSVFSGHPATCPQATGKYSVQGVNRSAAILLATLFAATAIPADHTPAPTLDRTPFGRIEDEDVDHFQEFALKRAGFDVKAEMARVYASGNKLDEEALGRVFSFSTQFSNFDKYARTYGQIIYSSFLKIGAVLGVPAYVKVIDRQPPDVQQRIRDFLFYPSTRHVPKERWHEALEETRQMYPTLFPKGFQFGNGDPIFANES